MKILIVLPNDSLGGAEQYLKLIATHYKEQNVSIYFLKNNNSTQWTSLKASSNQHFMSSKHEFFGLIRFIFMMLFKRNKYDYTFTSHVKTNALIGVLRSLGIITVTHHIARESTSIFLRYNGLKLKYYKILYAIGYGKINLIICQTDLMKSQFIKHNTKIAKNNLIAVIPNPIDLSIAKEKASESTNTIDYDYIVSAGRLIPEKGFDNLIKAFKQIKEQQKNLKLIILGNGYELENLQTITKTLQLTDDVIFKGHVENVYTYFKTAKLCVVSSIIEGFPNVLLQMMSQNNKVVSTLCAGGIQDIPGIYTCEINNDKLLASKILECLSNNTDHNTKQFNTFLNSRSIETFVKTINSKLETI